MHNNNNNNNNKYINIYIKVQLVKESNRRTSQAGASDLAAKGCETTQEGLLFSFTTV